MDIEKREIGLQVVHTCERMERRYNPSLKGNGGVTPLHCLGIYP